MECPCFCTTFIKMMEFLDAIPAYIFWKDKDSVYGGCNNRYAMALGLSSVKEIVGKTDFDFYPRELAEKYRADDHLVYTTGQSIIVEEEGEFGDEHIRVRTQKLPLMTPTQNIVGVIGIYVPTKQFRAYDDKIVERLEALKAKLTSSSGFEPETQPS